MEKAHHTVMEYAEHWLSQCPDKIWLRERKGDEFRKWSWQAAFQEFQPVAAWLEAEFGSDGSSIAILSKNRAHWTLADMAILASGNVSVPLFTTLIADTVDYILNFADVKLLVLGEAENWEKVRAVLPEHVRVLVLPGVQADIDALRWEDIAADYRGREPDFRCRPDTLFTIPFTSGTTGLPKGVMQNHDSMLVPIERAAQAMAVRDTPRFLSYLPLSHIAERQLVWIQSLVHGGQITYNEDLSCLLRDMADTRPTYFFGAPRVWEMLKQGIIGKFGSQEALDQALAENTEAVQNAVKSALGFTDYDYLLTAAAPTPSSLIHWFDRLGITVSEGYGQTEAMVLIVNTDEHRRVGSIGKPINGVEVRVSEEGELLCKADGLSPGYYKQPEKTAETFVDGWVHTGDKVRIDEDGFIFITGRVKDYFKTLQGKFVAPPPIEDAFAVNRDVEQLCLLGRGYSKTVMVCVVSEMAKQKPKAEVEAGLVEQAKRVNAEVEKHARIGAIIVTGEPWTIENGMLTPTLKMKRDEVEGRFGERAQQLAQQAAEQGSLLLEWS